MVGEQGTGASRRPRPMRPRQPFKSLPTLRPTSRDKPISHTAGLLRRRCPIGEHRARNYVKGPAPGAVHRVAGTACYLGRVRLTPLRRPKMIVGGRGGARRLRRFAPPQETTLLRASVASSSNHHSGRLRPGDRSTRCVPAFILSERVCFLHQFSILTENQMRVFQFHKGENLR